MALNKSLQSTPEPRGGPGAPERRRYAAISTRRKEVKSWWNAGRFARGNISLATAFCCALLRSPASALLADIQEGRVHSVAFIADLGPGCEPGGSIFSGIRAVAGVGQYIAVRNKALHATAQPLRGSAAPELQR